MNNKGKTFSVIFFVKNAKEKDGKVPIYARITVDGRRVDISLKRKIDQYNWHADKGMVKGSKDEIKMLQAYLEQYRSMIVTSYQQMVLERKLITAECVKSRVLNKEHYKHTLCSLINYHNTKMPDILSPGTMKNYFTTQRYLECFLKEHLNTSDIFLAELTYKFIYDFEFYLRKHQPIDHQRPLANNGVMKHLERLRKMVNLSIRLGWLEKDPFIQYKLKFNKVEKPYLIDEELCRIENKNFPIQRLANVRDLFVFSCYTGLAYIDVINLTPANISIGVDQGQWLIAHRQKTDIIVKVPLLPKALVIINTYKTNPKALHEGKLFPSISNQRLNSYLKEVATLCGIEKELTFHCARHTFATTVTLSNGVPIESVSKMLGHTKISTTQIYAKVIEKKLSDDMQLLRNRLALNAL